MSSSQEKMIEELKFLLFGLLICTSFRFSNGQAYPYACRVFPEPMKYLELKCTQTDDVMFEVDLQSSPNPTGGCDGSPTCTGLQQGVLTTRNQDCYWKCRCFIPLNSSYPIIYQRSDIHQESTCIGFSPRLFKSRGRCVKGSKVQNFYDVTRPIKRRKRTKDGVIRISDQYPWDYLGDAHHVITFKRNRKRKLVIGFLDVNIDEEMDTLKLSERAGRATNEQSVTMANLTSIYEFQSGDVSMAFSISSSSRLGRGFVMCFAWVGKNSRVNTHVCEVVQGVSPAVGVTIDSPRDVSCPTPSQRSGSRRNRNRGGRRRNSRRRTNSS